MYQKNDRVASIIQAVAAPILLDFAHIHEHEHGIITLQEVVVSADRSYADLMISAQHNTDTLAKFLAPVAGKIRHELAETDALARKVPQIRFKKANSENSEMRILDLIHRLAPKGE